MTPALPPISAAEVTAVPMFVAPSITWKVTVPWFTVEAAATVAVSVTLSAAPLKGMLELPTVVVVAAGAGTVFAA